MFPYQPALKLLGLIHMAKEAICNLMKHIFLALNMLIHGIILQNIILEFEFSKIEQILKMTLNQF